jgi:hypothetical protein
MRLDQNLNEKHPLFRLANAIDWEYFVREFGLLYVENKGRSAKETKKLKIYLGRVTRDIQRKCTDMDT